VLAPTDFSCHHMGTTRMGGNPRTSVVDPNCRVHGIANLHVAGSSVFPSSGYVNPTNTIVALSIRLADRLRDELART
jgi:choline dehydrogenase-like flavoprotein